MPICLHLPISFFIVYVFMLLFKVLSSHLKELRLTFWALSLSSLSFSLCFSLGKSLFSFIPKENFGSYNNLGWQGFFFFFSFSILNVSSLSFPTCKDSTEKLANRLKEVPLYITHLFSLVPFKVLIVLYDVIWTSWICMSISFPSLWKFFNHFSFFEQAFSSFLSLFSSGTFLMHILVGLMVSHGLLNFLLLFHSFYLFCSSD